MPTPIGDRRALLQRFLAGCVATFLAGCTGSIEGGPGSAGMGPASTGSTVGSTPGASTSGGMTPPTPAGQPSGGGALPPGGLSPGMTIPPVGAEPCVAEAALAPARLWRLTDDQYVNAVRQLFGVTISPEVSGARAEGATLNLSDVSVVNGTTAGNYQAAARGAAEKIVPNLATLLPCKSASPDTACVQEFVRTRVARAFRRPLADTEVADLMALYQLGVPDGASTGVRLILEQVLQSPFFIWRTEFGAGQAMGNKVTLTPFELASALGFFFLDSVPDDGLWAKATAGALTQPAVIAAEVDRLLAIPEVKTRLAQKAGTWLGLPRLVKQAKDAAMFPRFTTGVRDALIAGEEQFLHQVLFTGKFGDLFQSKRLFLNQELASLYGITGVTGTALTPVEVTTPDRAAGILSHPAVLAAHASPTKSDIIHRGLFIYDNLICGPRVPPPPATAIAAIGMQPKDATERELATLRQQGGGTCAGCHALFDPLGLVTLRYDAIGRYRDKDAAGQLIDDSSVITALGPGLDGPIAGVTELASRLATHRRVSDCAVTHLSTMVLGRSMNNDNSCALRAVKDAFAGSGAFSGMWKAIATSPGFATRGLN